MKAAKDKKKKNKKKKNESGEKNRYADKILKQPKKSL